MADAYATASDFLRQHYPQARVAFLGGSAMTSSATPKSDLDIFILLDDVEDRVSYVETTTHQNWLIEAFVYCRTDAEHWMQKGREERRPVLDTLAANGVPLTDNDETRAWAESAREALAAGPRAATRDEVDARRYALSALVDDLEGTADLQESYLIQATTFRESAELLLLHQHQWLGTGKWLVRNLRQTEDHGLLAWAGSDHDPHVLAAIARRILNTCGGYLQQGHVRGRRPAAGAVSGAVDPE